MTSIGYERITYTWVGAPTPTTVVIDEDELKVLGMHDHTLVIQGPTDETPKMLRFDRVESGPINSIVLYPPALPIE